MRPREGRTEWYTGPEQIQLDGDAYLEEYNFAGPTSVTDSPAARPSRPSEKPSLQDLPPFILA
jgi:hypothetical protein